MFKGKIYAPDGSVVFEGECDKSDFDLVYQKYFGAQPEKQTSLESFSLNHEDLPKTSEIRDYIETIPPSKRDVATVSQHFLKKPLSSKNRRLYTVFYQRLNRAKNKLRKENSFGIVRS